MDLLRFLLRLPLRLLLLLWSLLCWLGRGLGWLLARLVGRFSWQAPTWLRGVGSGLVHFNGWIRQHPAKASLSLVIVAALLGSGWYGYRWYQARPRPVEAPLITYRITAPAVTNVEENLVVVHPLRIQFSGSIAPLATVGKESDKGIQIEPAIAGTWIWRTDRKLEFQPKEDWPVGQQYQVRFDPAVAFAEHIRIEQTRFEFSSAAFEAKIFSSDFYQDPQDAAMKKAVVQVRFSHPVETADFEKRIDLRMAGIKGKDAVRKFVVNYDELKLNAFIHSEPLTVPADDTKLLVSIDKGVHALRGGAGIAAKLEGQINVPGLYSLNLDEVHTSLVDNDHFEPEQVLIVDVSHPVNINDITKSITAYVLPKYHPDTPESERHDAYDWGNTDEVSEAILQKSQKLALDPIPSEREYTELPSFKYHADPGQYIFVKVNKGLKSFGGYLLANHILNIVQVPQYPRMLRFMTEGSLLSLNGDRRVPIVARNVPGMELEIARVLPDQLQHLASMNYGRYDKPALGALSADHITERFVQQLTFPDNQPGKAHYESVDLGRYLGSNAQGKRGIFLLKLTRYQPKDPNAPVTEPTSAEIDPAETSEGDGEETSADAAVDESENAENEDESAVNDARLIVVTDLGMLVKKSLDGSQDVFVQSIHGGDPVREATVEIVATNGQILRSETTDVSGHVHFAALEGLTREKTPAMFVVRKGEDVSFLPVNKYDRKLDYSRFDIGGLRNAKDAGQLSAYLFSDRGIYRPGDSFHIGMIVRAADWTKSLTGIPLEAEIVDPRGVTVERRRLRLEATGFDELSYTTQENSPTGGWSVNLYIVKNDKNDTQIGSTTIQVKEFLPDRMKVRAQLSQSVAEGWVKPDGLKAMVSLQNLFGTPAQNRRIEASMTLSPAFPAFHSFSDYHFFDPRRAKEGYSTPLGDHTTNDQGETEFTLDLGKYANASYQLYFMAKGYEAEGGRSVAAAVTTLVSANDFLVGTKADGALDFIARDTLRHINLIAIDPQAKKTAVEGLQAVIVERKFVSILTKQDSGVYKYESRAKEVPVSERPLTLSAAGEEFTLPTATPGSFALIIKNAHGDELNRVDYAIAGEANLTRSLERNAELQLTLSKTDYAPGSDIEIAIRAPYVGSGLITLERDRIYAHAWFKATTTSSIQKIRVPADFEGNGYVNVQFVRDPSSDEIFMSPLTYGVVPFSVNRDARRNAITVSTPPLVKPGENLTMQVKSAQPARVVVFAVDEGILQVARYKLGDPLEFFFRKRMLEVQTAQILDLILPEFTKLMGMAAPGGDEDGMLGRHLNPFKRKHQKPVVYWSGIVDVQGERELTYSVPDDFNGRLRVMAVAVTANKVGIFENSTTVRGDFVLSPNVPAMVAPSDEFEVSVGVTNNLTGLAGKEVPIAVELTASPALEVLGSAKQELKLAEQHEGVAVFRLRAKEQLGAASLTFSASNNNALAKQTLETSVRPATTYRTDIQFGHLNQGSIEVKPLREMYDEHAKRDAASSYTPLVLARGLSAYLTDFPHICTCTEQLVSQAISALVLAKHPELGEIVHEAGQGAASDAWTAVLGTLRSRQNSEGGFGMWRSTIQADRYVSIYTMQFLIEAKERGWKVPTDMLNSGNGYLKQSAGDESDATLAGLRSRAFAAYLLTRQGNVTTNYLAAIQKRLQDRFPDTWRDDLAAAYIAASMQLLKQDKEAAKLIAAPEKILLRQMQEVPYRFEYYHDPLIRDAATLYLLARHFPERLSALSPQAVQNIVTPLGKGQYNTLSSAMSILALEAYAGQPGAGTDKLTIAVVQKDGASGPIAKPEGLLMRGAFAATAASVKISNESALPAWYSVSQSGFDRGAPTVEIKQGLEIVREYTNASGKPVSSVGLGEEIDVHLKIRATQGAVLSNIAIVDLLPGGFEPVLSPPPPTTGEPEASTTDAGEANPPVAWHSPVGVGNSTWQPEYADVRDDRVVIYGMAKQDVQEFIYRIKATNAGNFIVPPTYGESLYDRTVQARSLGARITVERR